MLKPRDIFVFFASIGIACWMLHTFVPQEWLETSRPTAAHAPNAEMAALENLPPDFSTILQDKMDSLAAAMPKKTANTLVIAAAGLEKKKTKKVSSGDTLLLRNFYEKLSTVQTNMECLRVWHYGDSQIEGDRISAFVRDKLQKRFGGYGPGLVSVVEALPTPTINQKHSDNWKRYTVFGKRDKTIPHTNYGVAGHFCRFTPVVIDSLAQDTTLHKAWFAYSPSKVSYKRTRTFDLAKLLLGNITADLTIRVFVGDSLFATETLVPSQAFKTLTYKFPRTPSEVKFELESTVSPDIYGVSLENNQGVHLDNVAMRGSAGTIFRKLPKDQLKSQYASLGADLILLQYGGNTVPYISSEEKATQYGKWFESQIRYFKQILPDATIVLLGPSDMDQMVDGEYVTYPYLGAVREALQATAERQNCVYFDIFDAMGGDNSMHEWATASPKLAGSDHIHFTPKGARKIAAKFHEFLMKDFDAWEKESVKYLAENAE